MDHFDHAGLFTDNYGNVIFVIGRCSAVGMEDSVEVLKQ